MTSWKLARYLIDAKKCVDSIFFIGRNRSRLTNLDLREKINGKRSIFYINCCIVLDGAFPRQKGDLCSRDKIVDRMYYERDKNFAHKDPDYKPIKYDSVVDIATELKDQLNHLRELCSDALPSVVALDFVPHDKELYRHIHGLTVEKETIVESAKCPFKDVYDVSCEGAYRKVFSDTEDMRDIDPVNIGDYATMVENGINDYEGLQNRQDFASRLMYCLA